jgi:hypothetical protein
MSGQKPRNKEEDSIMDKDQPIEHSEFSTMDLYLGGYLTMKGHKGIIRFSSASKAVLIFTRTPELDTVLKDYVNDPVFEFVQTVKDIRAQLHRHREERQGGNLV